MRSNDEATLTNNVFNLFGNDEHIVNGKCIESIDYVGMMTTVNDLLEFSGDYSRSAAANMLWYEDKILSVDPFKAEN